MALGEQVGAPPRTNTTGRARSSSVVVGRCRRGMAAGIRRGEDRREKREMAMTCGPCRHVVATSPKLPAKTAEW
jgi:hypothetical protein